MNRLSHRPARQGGFTLIELIVVIVILGVLAAVALPRFTNLQADARYAKLSAYAGTIKAAGSLAKSTAITRGVSCGGTGSVTMEGTAVALNFCYPAAAAGGIDNAANLTNPASDGYTLTYAGTTATLQITGATTPSMCQLTYTEPAGADTAPTVVVTPATAASAPDFC
jgi:MSHA pilin protein MshA